MKANYEDKKQSTAEVNLGNLYDVNKQLMMQEPCMNQADIDAAKNHLQTWLNTYFCKRYFMLLCHELRDYTIFNLDKTDSWQMAPDSTLTDATNDIIECMTNRGKLLTIDQQEDQVWELWIRNSEGCFAYYLFPYGDAVLEY